LCSPCLRIAIYEQLTGMRLLQSLKSANFNATTAAQLVNVTVALTLGCSKDLRDNTYCLKKVLAMGDQTAVLALLQPCLAALGSCPSDCLGIIKNLYNTMGCCMGTFIRSANIALSGAGDLARSILEPCKYWPVPQVCSNKIMTITVPFNNLATTFVDTTGILVNATCNAINADPLDVQDVSCTAPAADGSVTCTAHVWADTDAEAVARVAYFNGQVKQTIRLLAADVGVSLDDRTNPAMPAYSAASITATADNSCLKFQYPVSYSMNTATGQCVQNPSAASTLSIHAIVYLAVAALLAFFL